VTRRLTPPEWATLAQRLQQAGETHAAERLRALVAQQTACGATGEIEIHVPAGVAAAVERIERKTQ